jgi:BASS family bile acid:Na+ symporter
LLTNLFPVWIALGACVGLTAPSLVTWFSGNLITGALAFTMLGMGLTIDETDFTSVLRSPKQLVAGVALQYSVMPLLAFALSRVLPTPLAVGLILVGCCPGGTASNLVTYIASANVALSVVLTALSTALATVVTPALTAGLAGTLVPVPASSLMYSTGQVVLLPVCLGLALRRMFRTQVDHLSHWCPPIAVATVALICASVIGNNATFVRAAGLTLVASVVALHAGGFSLGYVCSTLLGFSERERRTISIEVGMQNSALGVVLALAHFGPASAVPAAISASTHSILGSMFAAIWRWSDARRSSSLSSELPIGGTVYI